MNTDSTGCRRSLACFQGIPSTSTSAKHQQPGPLCTPHTLHVLVQPALQRRHTPSLSHSKQCGGQGCADCSPSLARTLASPEPRAQSEGTLDSSGAPAAAGKEPAAGTAGQTTGAPGGADPGPSSPRPGSTAAATAARASPRAPVLAAAPGGFGSGSGGGHGRSASGTVVGGGAQPNTVPAAEAGLAGQGDGGGGRQRQKRASGAGGNQEAGANLVGMACDVWCGPRWACNAEFDSVCDWAWLPLLCKWFCGHTLAKEGGTVGPCLGHSPELCSPSSCCCIKDMRMHQTHKHSPFGQAQLIVLLRRWDGECKFFPGVVAGYDAAQDTYRVCHSLAHWRMPAAC